ncbi:hypothetical protein GP486_002138 [Trichoglossum hirsutum]|uniref:Uncharacterized protein n=1 Tax=Trichoglossum hirsutum TaxID=265104 RepID=A0A9P8LFN0_9PEZI|nr:hypothetical protein GP486_002138 [Trichoglossum hirsutum]
MDRAPPFYPTSEVLRIHPDWPLLRPRTPTEHSESEWTAYSRTSSRSSSYLDVSNAALHSRPNWPFPARTSSLGSHLTGDGYSGSINTSWGNPPNLTSAFDSDSEDEDDKPRRLVRKLKKKTSSSKSVVDRRIFTRSVDEETHSLSQDQRSGKDSARHYCRKVSIHTTNRMPLRILICKQWSLFLPKMPKSISKSEKPKSDKNLDARRSSRRFFYSENS